MITDEKETKYLKLWGNEIPVWIYGDPKNPLIYFIHGYFNGFSDYIGDLPPRHLMKNFCVVAFDLPGFGVMKKFKKDRVEYIAQIIESTSNGRRFVLFGTSYGALLSLKYYSRYPDKVKGIVIAGMPYFFGFRKTVNILRLPIINKLNISKTLKEFKFLNKNNISNINVPVLLYYSSKDRMASTKMGENVLTLFPKAQIYTIDKYNHKWHLHDIRGSGFLEKIEGFIKSLR